jgi:glucosamine kinase
MLRRNRRIESAMTPRELRATLERLDLSWMDRATATDYATLAPLVMRHADAGDRVGRRIVREAAEQIDELVRRLIECGAPRVALIGGLASSMEPWLAPDVQRRLSPVEGDAVAGALHLARRRAVTARVR